MSKFLEDVESGSEQLLRSTLIGNLKLELLLFLVAILITVLQVDSIDLTGEVLVLQLQVRNQGQKFLLLCLLALSLHLEASWDRVLEY